MKKLTDEQIIIALKSSKEAADTDEVRNFLDDVIECINRKNAEIERLKSMNQSKLDTIHDIRAELAIAQSEAVKEFAEQLKTKCHNYYPSIDSYCVSAKAVGFKDIDDLVKEMVGENNG